MKPRRQPSAVLKREIAGQEAYRKEVLDERAAQERRSKELEEALALLDEEIVQIDQKGHQLSQQMATIEETIRQKTADLSDAKKEIV